MVAGWNSEISPHPIDRLDTTQFWHGLSWNGEFCVRVVVVICKSEPMLNASILVVVAIS